MFYVKAQGFRCFNKPMPARIAPITILVGDNSSGKSSFLAATRLLWDATHGRLDLNFNEAPFALGSFEQIAHFRGGKAGRVREFTLGIMQAHKDPTQPDAFNHRYSITFGKRGVTPYTKARFIQFEEAELVEQYTSDGLIERIELQLADNRIEIDQEVLRLIGLHRMNRHDYYPFSTLNPSFVRILELLARQESGAPTDSPEVRQRLRSVSKELLRPSATRVINGLQMALNRLRWSRPIGTAPVRTEPQRTYNPARDQPDAAGSYVPTAMATLAIQDKAKWLGLKDQLERFGKTSGLFDRIKIRTLGRAKASDPFQLEIKILGMPVNLADVGYGVSQVLPILYEALSASSNDMLMLQQPEVHLHPKAQAELGSLFCRLATAKNMSFLVETHSDFIIDRIRHEVRKKTIKAEDVSILYFERKKLDVEIHSLSLDEMGNYIDCPPDFREFFLAETLRVIGAE